MYIFLAPILRFNHLSFPIYVLFSFMCLWSSVFFLGLHFFIPSLSSFVFFVMCIFFLFCTRFTLRQLQSFYFQGEGFCFSYALFHPYVSLKHILPLLTSFLCCFSSYFILFALTFFLPVLLFAKFHSTTVSFAIHFLLCVFSLFRFILYVHLCQFWGFTDVCDPLLALSLCLLYQSVLLLTSMFFFLFKTYFNMSHSVPWSLL